MALKSNAVAGSSYYVGNLRTVVPNARYFKTLLKAGSMVRPFMPDQR